MNDITGIIARLRLHKYAVTTEIEKRFFKSNFTKTTEMRQDSFGLMTQLTQIVHSLLTVLDYFIRDNMFSILHFSQMKTINYVSTKNQESYSQMVDSTDVHGLEIARKYVKVQNKKVA